VEAGRSERRVVTGGATLRLDTAFVNRGNAGELEAS
jgi:hypothetical protein